MARRLKQASQPKGTPRQRLPATNGQNPNRLLFALIGAGLVALFGFLALICPSQPLTSWSYDLLHRLRPIQGADEIVIVYMDDESHRELKQPWFQKWDRELHARLIRKLTDCGTRVIAFDILFDLPDTNNPSADETLIESARAHGKVITAAKLSSVIIDGQVALKTPTVPFESLRKVVQWGVAEGGDEDGIIRLHSPGLPNIKSLAWKAAEAAGANLPNERSPQRWLNYYGPPGTLPWVSFRQALQESIATCSSIFSNKIVFVGAVYDVGFTGGKGSDHFRTPYSLWTERRSAGVEINATACANLVRREWLKLLSPWSELGIILFLGAAVGYGAAFTRPTRALLMALILAGVTIYLSSLWAAKSHTIFSWLVVAAQLLIAVIWSIFVHLKSLEMEKQHLQGLLVAVPQTATPVVQFTVTSALFKEPSRAVQIIIWAHSENELQEVLRRARETSPETEIISLPRSRQPTDTVLSVHLAIDGVGNQQLEESLVWNGTIANVKFVVHLPSDERGKHKGGRALVYASALKIATLHFTIDLLGQTVTSKKLLATEQRAQRAFACYARADIDAVLARIQGMQKAMPDLEVFMDVASLRAGQDWEEEVRNAIRSSDCLYLFWSGNASASKEVEKEWRYALHEKGIEFINPVPLVSPELVPPPPELKAIHFNDWTLAFRRGTDPNSAQSQSA